MNIFVASKSDYIWIIIIIIIIWCSKRVSYCRCASRIGVLGNLVYFLHWCNIDIREWERVGKLLSGRCLRFLVNIDMYTRRENAHLTI